MTLKFIPISKTEANQFRSGEVDANGNEPEHMIADGAGYPCRCCLGDIEEGKGMLLLSYKPFSSIQPYAETGPIFICEEECEPFGNSNNIPSNIACRSQFLIRGYCSDERIVEGTGKYVSRENLETELQALLDDDQIDFAHIRSGTNSCFQCRVEGV